MSPFLLQILTLSKYSIPIHLSVAVLQKNNKVLRGLIGALLHLDPESLDVRITNPIILGQSF